MCCSRCERPRHLCECLPAYERQYVVVCIQRFDIPTGKHSEYWKGVQPGFYVMASDHRNPNVVPSATYFSQDRVKAKSYARFLNAKDLTRVVDRVPKRFLTLKTETAV